MSDFDKAIETQAELARWWSRSENIEYGRSLCIKMMQIPETKAAFNWATTQQWMLRDVPTVFVTPEMSHLVEVAGTSMPPEPFRLHLDAPADEGFAYFAKPIISVSDDDQEYPFSAFTWITDLENGLTSVTIYADSDQVATSLAMDKTSKLEGFPVPEWRAQMCSLTPVNLLLFRDGEEPREGYLEYGRFIKALWAISQQRISVTTLGRPSRSTSRRLERSKFPLGEIRIVTLRRREHQPTDVASEHIEWSHRWLVSGHWRNQWLPSRRDHRLQWIPEYIKGPEDKPLVVKPTVYRVAR